MRTESITHLVGDYYFPTCMLTDDMPMIGKWADIYERYLQEKHPHEYARLIWSNELRGLLEFVQRECVERLEILTRKIAETEGINEALKTNDQLGWVQRMNNIRNRAEEMVLIDMIRRITGGVA